MTVSDERLTPMAHAAHNRCFGCGPANPGGLHLEFLLAPDGTVVCPVTIPETFDGNPGYLHGGIIATLLDETMSKAVRALGLTAMTRKEGSIGAAAREIEGRRPDLTAAARWKEERGQRVFVDYNQNAPHKTVFGAWSVRARPGAQVSTPIAWDELDEVHPDQFTIASLPQRLEEVGDPWAAMYDDPQSLEPLLEMNARDRASGLLDAPWPPVYPKQPDEPPRVAPSRAKKA